MGLVLIRNQNPVTERKVNSRRNEIGPDVKPASSFNTFTATVFPFEKEDQTNDVTYIVVTNYSLPMRKPRTIVWIGRYLFEKIIEFDCRRKNVAFPVTNFSTGLVCTVRLQAKNVSHVIAKLH